MDRQDWLRLASRFASVEVLQQIRFELTLRGIAARARLSRRQRALVKRIHDEKERGLKVNLGSGPLPTPGWLNIDGFFDSADLIQVFGAPLELPDGCARFVFSEHVLEHLDYPGAARTFLEEAFRLLEPGGWVRIVVPDAERVIEAYVKRDTALLASLAPGETTAIGAVNRIFREGGFHRYAWDYETLEGELLRAGFVEVERSSFRGGQPAELQIDFEEEARILQSLYVEARRPGPA